MGTADQPLARLLNETVCPHSGNHTAYMAECDHCLEEALEGYKAGTWPPKTPKSLAERIAAAIQASPTCTGSHHDNPGAYRFECIDCCRAGNATPLHEIIMDALRYEPVSCTDAAELVVWRAEFARWYHAKQQGNPTGEHAAYEALVKLHDDGVED